jgi:hypothetical protein
VKERVGPGVEHGTGSAKRLGDLVWNWGPKAKVSMSNSVSCGVKGTKALTCGELLMIVEYPGVDERLW